MIGAKDLSHGGPLVGAFPDDRLEGTDARFHLDQDRIQAMVKPDIRRAAARTRDWRFDRGSPARMAKGEHRLDEIRVRGIVDERGRFCVDREAKFGAEDRRGAGSDPWRNVAITVLDPTDDRTSDADGSGHGCLAEAGTQPNFAELVTEPGAGAPELAVAPTVSSGSIRAATSGIEARLANEVRLVLLGRTGGKAGRRRAGWQTARARARGSH